MNMEERLRSHYESLSRAIDFTRMADAKAGPVLVVQFALAGTLAARFEQVLPIIVGDAWDLSRMALFVIMLCYAVFLVAIVLIAVRVYMPFSPKTGKSLIYFEDVAALDFEIFRSKSMATSTEEIERELLDQIYRVSQIASAKMSRVRWAIYLSVPSVFLWLMLLVLGSGESV